MVRLPRYNEYEANRCFVYDSLLNLLTKLKFNFQFLDNDEILFIYDNDLKPVLKFDLINYSNNDLLGFFTLLKSGVIDDEIKR